MAISKTKKLNQRKKVINDSIWLSKHDKELEKYAGKWIAILNGKLLAVGNSVKEVMEKAEEQGIDELPLVVKRPKKFNGWYVL